MIQKLAKKNNFNSLKLKYPNDSDAYIKFLVQTKSGEYATIEKSSLPYSRKDDLSETIIIEDIYSYSLY